MFYFKVGEVTPTSCSRAPLVELPLRHQLLILSFDRAQASHNPVRALCERRNPPWSSIPPIWPSGRGHVRPHTLTRDLSVEQGTDQSTAINWSDARRRVLKGYREWLRAVRLQTPGCVQVVERDSAKKSHTGPRNSTTILPQHARVPHPNESQGRI
jgi:hypothetical protein